MKNEQNKKSKIPQVLAGIMIAAGVGIAGVGAAHAATATNTTNPMNALVDKISTKFNLNKEEVQKVFDEQRTEMDATREQAQTDRLAQAVKDGKLSQEQMDKIVVKQKELQASRPAFDRGAEGTKTDAERQVGRDAMKKQMTEIKQWATDNNVPMEYLMPGGQHGGKGHTGPDGNKEKGHKGDRGMMN